MPFAASPSYDPRNIPANRLQCTIPRMSSFYLLLSLIFLCVAFASTGLFAAEQGIVNRMSEMSFTSTMAYADPFNEVRLDMLVTAADGAQLRVPAFWAGKQN